MSAELKVDADAIAYGSDWRVTFADIRVIGEFLSKQGRGRSRGDHFLVFMTREEWFKALYETAGREQAMAELGQRLNAELRCDLFNATNFSSRVIWPPHLEGQPLFDLIPEERSPNLVTRVRQLLMQKVDMRFTEEVRRELGHL